MSITSRISSMEEHVTNAYNGLQGLGADLTGIDKNIDNIASVLDDIYDDLPKITGSGTSITLDDTRKGRLESTLSGNTSQFTTTGKNKLDTTEYSSRSVTGITITPNYEGKLLKNIKVSGTPTATNWINMKNVTFEPGTYIISGLNVTQSGKTGLRVGLYFDSDRQYFITVNSPTYTFTLNETTTAQFIIWVQNVADFPTNDTYITPMVRLSSVSDDTYEPFTNGASPNPDYPQEVHIVSGDNEINVTGRNLLEGVEYGEINSNSGVESGSTTVIRGTNYIPYDTSSTYYVSVNSSLASQGINLRFYNASKEYLGWSTLTGSGQNLYINIGTQVTATDLTPKYFKFRQTLSAGPITSLNDNVMITTVNDMNYEPYSSNSYPINLGVKNLWNSEDMKSGYLPQSGSYPTTDPSYPNARYVLVNLLKGQSITLSGSTSDQGRVRCIDKDTNQVVNAFTVTDTEYYTTTHSFGDGFYEATITAKKDFIVGIMDMNGSVNNLIVNYGTRPSTISDNPIELCKIGTYQDYFYKDNGSWYLHKEIGKVVLNGSENISIYNQNTSRTNFQVDVLTGIENYLGNYVVPNLLSNMFNVVSQSASWVVGNISRRKEAQTTLYLTYEPSTTIDQFKAWLSTNNVNVYYIYATPTNEEITYQPLIDQLNELERAMSKDGQTNISQVNNDLPFIISASALKEWQENTSLNSTLSMVNPLSLGNTLNTQEIENNTQPIEVDNIEPLEEEENEES